MGFVVFVLIVVLLSVVVRLLAVELLPVVGPVLAAEPLVLAEPEPAALAEALPVLDLAADKPEPVAEQV